MCSGLWVPPIIPTCVDFNEFDDMSKIFIKDDDVKCLLCEKNIKYMVKMCIERNVYTNKCMKCHSLNELNLTSCGHIFCGKCILSHYVDNE